MRQPLGKTGNAIVRHGHALCQPADQMLLADDRGPKSRDRSQRIWWLRHDRCMPAYRHNQDELAREQRLLNDARSLLFGRFADSPRPFSYVAAAADEAIGYEVDFALDHLLPWLGSNLARPISDLLASLNASGTTLIVSGPLASVPLHAATWQEGGHDVCLLDRFSVRYAPSADLERLSLARWRQAEAVPPFLVALGNPPGANLPAAEAEVAEIKKHRRWAGRVRAAVGCRATTEFIRAHLSSATHLHLACHGQGSPLVYDDSFVTLADGDIRAGETVRLAGPHLALTVVSACKTAISHAEIADEAFSIGTSFLASGSAAVVATLWSVNDYATALLMTKFYGELLGDEKGGPSQCLRAAQTWLRDLTEPDEEAFLNAHPDLQEVATHTARGGLRTHRTRQQRPALLARPFSHPYYWGAFVAFGV